MKEVYFGSWDLWVSTKWASGGKPSRLLAKWLNCILLVNLPSLSILLEITNTGSRSRSGRRHPPVCKRINSWQIIENYYILTECFRFNLCSFSSLHSTSCPGNSQANHMWCKSLTWRHSASQMWILWRNKSPAGSKNQMLTTGGKYFFKKTILSSIKFMSFLDPTIHFLPKVLSDCQKR